MIMFYQYIKTVFINFKYLTNLIKSEVRKKTAERLVANVLLKKQHLIKDKKNLDPNLIKKYQDICNAQIMLNHLNK